MSTPLPHSPARDVGLALALMIGVARRNQRLYYVEFFRGVLGPTSIPRQSEWAAPTVSELGNRYDLPARGRGEIGIHDGFRCHCSKEREGSSPSARTGVVSRVMGYT